MGITPRAAGERAAVRPPADGRHVPALDVVRGIAILLVTAYRFNEGPADPAPVGKALFRLFSFGDRGVDLFFVLSGFLITGILFDAKGGAHYFRNFYARRVLRIFPLYYGVLFLAFVVLPRAWPAVAAQFAGTEPHQGWLWLYGANIVQARDESWATLGWFNHFWSLAVEEHYYLLWPLVIWALSRRAAMAACVLTAACAVGFRYGLADAGRAVAAEVLTPCRMDALAAGSFFALAVRGPGGFRAWRWWAVAAGLAAVALLAALAGWNRVAGHLGDGALSLRYSLYAGFFASAVVLMADPARNIGTGPIGRALGFFARYAYGMYVFQNLLLPFLQQALPPEELVARTGSVLVGRLAFIAAGGGVTLAVAVASYHLYEVHFLRLKKLFPQRPSVRSAPHH